MSSCKALGGVKELPAAHVGSWKVDKFKDLASLVKMSFKFRGYIGAFVCFKSVPKPMGRAQMINQMQVKTVGQTWSVLHCSIFQGSSAEFWFLQEAVCCTGSHN